MFKRECRDCGMGSDDLELFQKNSQSKYGRRNLCIPCGGKRTAIQKKRDPEGFHKWQTDYQTRKRYGVDVETYRARMATSDVCEVCGGTNDALCYDHCHDTMAFRGVLCRACNRSIGQLGDTAEALQRALNYLTRNSK